MQRPKTVNARWLVYEFLSAPLVIDIVESETLPHAKMLVYVHVFLSFFFGDFSSKVLHDAATLAFGPNVDYWPKLAALNLFSWQRWSNPDDYPEILTRWLVHTLRADSSMVSTTLGLHTGIAAGIDHGVVIWILGIPIRLKNNNSNLDTLTLTIVTTRNHCASSTVDLAIAAS